MNGHSDDIIKKMSMSGLRSPSFIDRKPTSNEKKEFTQSKLNS